MKFNVPSKTFYTSASAVIKVINPKSPMTILANFLLTLKDNELIISGSDIENSVSAHIEVKESEGSGSVCVDAKRLVELLKEIPDQGIEVSLEDGKATIKYSSGACEFTYIDGVEYPQTKKDENEGEPVSFTVPGEILRKGIDYTLFAAATEDYRPIMMGVLFDVKEDRIVFATTDTRKLVKYEDANCAPGVAVSRVIPPKPCSVLRSIYSGEGEVKVTFTSKSATFENDSFSFNCRLLQGSFPDYNRVIPRNNNLLLTVDRQQLLSSVRRVGLCVSQDYGLEKFLITPDRVEIKSQDPNLLTQAHEEMTCSFSGQRLVIGFSAPLLTEILSVLPTDDITIALADSGRPGLFQPGKDEEGTSLIMLLMPMACGEF